MTVTPTVEPDSLRERKRRATQAAIEDSATALVLEHGYDAVTVEQICEAAEVSKRTFFNYVPSKEAAVVGVPPESVPDASRERFLRGGDADVPAALLGVYLGAFASARSGDDARAAALVHRRRRIFREHPPLAAARMTATTCLREELVRIVTELFARHPHRRRLEGVRPEVEARACVGLVAAAANLGVAAWLDRTAGTLADLDADCAATLRHLAVLAASTADDSAPTPTGSAS